MFTRNVFYTTKKLTIEEIEKAQQRFNPDFTIIVGPVAPETVPSQVRYEKSELPTRDQELPTDYLLSLVYLLENRSGHFIQGDKILISPEIDETITLGLFAFACRLEALPIIYNLKEQQPFSMHQGILLAYKIFNK